MREKSFCVSYEEYDSVNELKGTEKIAAEAAIEAMDGSYAPYSGFNVGAAAILSDGTVVKGANQENAAYPSGLCAERVALFSAHSLYPDKNVVMLAIAARDKNGMCKSPASPCGACRQVMAQTQLRSGGKMKVVLVGSEKVMVFRDVDSLLPFMFDNI